MMKIGIMKSKKNATYVEKRFVLIKNTKRDLNYKKVKIIVILQENLEELLIAFVI